MPAFTKPRLRETVLEKIPEDILASVMSFAKKQRSSFELFGVNKEKPGFFNYMVLLALFKDLKGIGLNKLKKSLPSNYHMSNDSLTDNIKQIRRMLGNFGITKVKLRKPSKWHRRGTKVNLTAVPPEEKSGSTVIHFFLDSVDFKTSGTNRSISGSDPGYSWKESAAAVRYQVLTDTRGTVRRIWGPFSPKTFDGDWLKLMSESLSTELAGANILADGHYACGRDKTTVPGVRFLVPYPENQTVADSVVPERRSLTPKLVLGRKKKNFNDLIGGLRGRVESPFGLVKQRWEALKGKWADQNDEQHRCLVTFAFAVENMIRK